MVIAGALDLEQTAEGAIPRRLPAWAQPQIAHDPMGALATAMAAGVRLRFATDARTIELDVLTTMIRFRGRPLRAAVFDLVVADEHVGEQLVEGGHVHEFSFTEPPAFFAGEPVTLRFDGLDAGSKEIEIWLPQSAVVELRALRLDGDAAPPADRKEPLWIHYGSSISHCVEAHSPTRTWPALVARRNGLDLLSLGFGGNCHLDQFVARTIRDLPAALISLKVGINIVGGDTLKLRTFVPALHGFLDTVRDGHPTTPILVSSSIVCPSLEDAYGPMYFTEDEHLIVASEPAVPLPFESSLTLRRSREVIAELIAERGTSDPALHYLDGLMLFGHDDADRLPDGLHPDGDGYATMAERFHQAVFDCGGPFAHVHPSLGLSD